MMQQHEQSDDLGFCPSFNCYSSNTLASAAAAAAAAGRISSKLQEHREHAAQFQDEDEFEFSLVTGDEEFSPEDSEAIDSDGRTVFPLFNRDLIRNDVDRETARTKLVEQENACTTSLQKLFVADQDESATSSSSEADESDGKAEAPAVFCVWRNKPDAGASPLYKCNKSRSTGSGSGSGSRRWRIRDLLRRSNSEGKEPMVMFPKQKLSSGEVPMFAGKSKQSSPSVHEVFYVQQRAKREVVKRKSYLPYRQGLVGFFSHVNGNVNGNGGKGKKSPF